MPSSCAEILDLLWQITWQASVIALLVMLIRGVFGQLITAGWRHALWGLVLVRLMMPALPHSPTSAFSLVQLVSHAGASKRSEVDRQQIETPLGYSITCEPLRSPVVLPTRLADRFESHDTGHLWSNLLVLIWLVVAGLLFSRRTWTNLRFNRRLNHRRQAPVSAHVFELMKRARREMKAARLPSLIVTDAVDAPAVAGVLHPKILLPIGLSERLSDSEVRLVLLHELSHVKQFDVAMDWLWAFAQSLHWFNPLLWIIAPIRRLDRELARDEMVLSVGGRNQAECYGRMLIDLAASNRRTPFSPGLIGMMGMRRGLQRRVKMIASFNGKPIYSAWIGIALLTVAASCMLTSPRIAAKSGDIASSETTTAPTQESRNREDVDLAQQAALDRRLPENSLNASHLFDVIKYLREQTGANVEVDWTALERAGISRDAPVTTLLRDTKLSVALELIFKSVEGEDEDQKLAYSLDDGVITISTRKELNKYTVTRRYEVNDLIFIPPDYNNAPNLSLQQAAFHRATTSKQSPFGEMDGSTSQTESPDRNSRIADIRNYIIENVDRNSWKETGGTVGSIATSLEHSVLLITHTPAVQHRILALLDDLRQSASKQLSIETREIAVDENSESSLPQSLQSRLASVRNAGRYRMDQFLTDDEVSLLVKVVGAHASSTSLTAPRLTLFSGQRTVLVVQTQQAYVADLKQVSDKSHTGKRDWHYEAVTESTTATGVVISITACSSPDGKYVFVDLDNQVARLLALIPETYGTTKDNQEGTIQRPISAIFKVKAACGIPDRATLLLGGNTVIESGDTKINADSPGLEKTKAAVARITKEQNHRHIYLLIRPTIYSHDLKATPASKSGQ